ncbi:MAG: hypothetical protein OEL87_03670 [Nanoarchaeota archaeon]|nr:hypothetical protein [Nanoarchaeota archaeon]
MDEHKLYEILDRGRNSQGRALISLEEMEILLDANAGGFSINNKENGLYRHFVNMPYFPFILEENEGFCAITETAVRYSHCDNKFSTIGASCRD